jgi:opacity protein-like surface antigen
MKKIFLLFLLISATAAGIQAQSRSSMRLGIQVSPALGTFAANTPGSLPAGFYFGLSKGLLHNVLQAGLDLGITSFGREKTEVTRLREGRYVEDTYAFANSLLDIGVSMRIRPFPNGGVRPFAELSAGVTHVSTDLEITGEGLVECDAANTINIGASNSFNYGIGAGTLVQIGSGSFLDLSVVYRKSGTATYYHKNAENVRSSEIELLQTRIGINFEF